MNFLIERYKSLTFYTVFMKELSKKISNEIWLKPRYAIARFMKKKIAFKTNEFQPMIFTLKIIKEKLIEEEIQLHLRFKGKDFWNNLDDDLDIDIYIPVKEFEKVKELSKNGNSLQKYAVFNPLRRKL